MGLGPETLPQALLSQAGSRPTPWVPAGPICWHRCQGGGWGQSRCGLYFSSQAPAPLCSWPSAPGSVVCCFGPDLAQEKDGENGLQAPWGPTADLCTPIGLLPPAAWYVTREPDAHGWLAGGTSRWISLRHSCCTSTWDAAHHDGPIPQTPACAPGPAPNACPAPGVEEEEDGR